MAALHVALGEEALGIGLQTSFMHREASDEVGGALRWTRRA